MPAADLVEYLYEAALDSKAWGGWLLELEAALGGVVTLSLRHPVPGDPGVVLAPSLDPAFLRSYQERYFALDPLRDPMEAAPVGRLAGPPKTLERDLRETRFFREWMEPQALRPIPPLAGVVDREPSGSLSLLAVFRPRGARRPSPAQRRLGSRLMPHLRRALRIHTRVTEAEREARALASAVDRIPVGLILVDERRHVRATNRTAEGILAGRDGLELDREGLCVVDDAEQTERLHRLIREATAPGAGEDEAASRRLLLVPRASGRRALQLLVARIRPVRDGSQPPIAAVFVCDSDRELPDRPQLLQRLFELTPAETALARRLASGHPLEQSAQELGIAIGTARQRLQQIFAKTQTKRQSDLVRLLLTGPAQLLGEPER